MNKIKLTAGILAVLLLTGCANGEQSSNSSSTTSSSITSPSSDISKESSSESTTSSVIPKGEPTVFTGPDGEPIYASEITAIDGTDKTAANLTKTDYGTSVICDGFQYFTEPSGISYNNYQNSEMFDDILFKGEIPENKNSCRRLNVGDKICGLTLVSAASEFKIDDYANTPEPYYYDGLDFANDGREVAEFDGTITIEGFLGIGARSSYDPDGGLLGFSPTESKLPVLGAAPEFYERTNLVTSSLCVFSDMTSVQCGYFDDLKCDSAGLGIGDVALVRVTLSNIKYSNSQSVSAVIENIELLSDVIYHAKDTV